MATTNDEDYYTDLMRSAVAGIHNKHGMVLDITQMSDEDGPYLVLLIKETEYTKFGVDPDVAYDVAKYIVDIHTALRNAGARVTYLVLEDS